MEEEGEREMKEEGRGREREEEGERQREKLVLVLGLSARVRVNKEPFVCSYKFAAIYLLFCFPQCLLLLLWRQNWDSLDF